MAQQGVGAGRQDPRLAIGPPDPRFTVDGHIPRRLVMRVDPPAFHYPYSDELVGHFHDRAVLQLQADRNRIRIERQTAIEAYEGQTETLAHHQLLSDFYREGLEFRDSQYQTERIRRLELQQTVAMSDRIIEEQAVALAGANDSYMEAAAEVRRLREELAEVRGYFRARVFEASQGARVVAEFLDDTIGSRSELQISSPGTERHDLEAGPSGYGGRAEESETEETMAVPEAEVGLRIEPGAGIDESIQPLVSTLETALGEDGVVPVTEAVMGPTIVETRQTSEQRPRVRVERSGQDSDEEDPEEDPTTIPGQEGRRVRRRLA